MRTGIKVIGYVFYIFSTWLISALNTVQQPGAMELVPMFKRHIYKKYLTMLVVTGFLTVGATIVAYIHWQFNGVSAVALIVGITLYIIEYVCYLKVTFLIYRDTLRTDHSTCDPH